MYNRFAKYVVVCILGFSIVSCGDRDSDGKDAVKIEMPAGSEGPVDVKQTEYQVGFDLADLSGDWTPVRTGLDDEALPKISSEVLHTEDSVLVDGYTDLYGRTRIPFDGSANVKITINARQQDVLAGESARHIMSVFLLDSDGQPAEGEFSKPASERSLYLASGNEWQSFETTFQVNSPSAKWLRPHLRFNSSLPKGNIVEVKDVTFVISEN